MQKTIREYWDAELKHQSKSRLKALQEGLLVCGGIIHNQYESKYFKGKLAWRNPLVLRLSLPKGKRWEFISKTKIWLAKPAKLMVVPVNIIVNLPDWCDRKHRRFYEPIPLRANHNNLNLRRSYNFQHGWIKDYHVPFSGYDQYNIIKDRDILAAVLDGNLDLILL